MDMMNNGDGFSFGDGLPFGGGFFFLPLAMIADFDRGESGKMAHDRQNVYVNGDYVGDKISLTQNDDGLKAIEDYLASRNFQGYKVSQEGDRIYIDVEDETERDNIKNHLEVYTQIR